MQGLANIAGICSLKTSVAANFSFGGFIGSREVALIRRAGVLLLRICLAGTALAGCSLGQQLGGPYTIDPAHYSVYHCKDLVARLKELHDRQKELRNLMAKASEGGGGTVIGTLAYGPDYDTALNEEKVLRRSAAEKKCEVDPPVLESDQIIR